MQDARAPLREPGTPLFHGRVRGILRWIVSRVLGGAFVLWAVATLIFFGLRMFPGDPAEASSPRKALANDVSASVGFDFEDARPGTLRLPRCCRCRRWCPSWWSWWYRWWWWLQWPGLPGWPGRPG